MAMTFKERLALAASQGTNIEAKKEVVEEKKEEIKVSRFGKPIEAPSEVEEKKLNRFGIAVDSPANNPLAHEPFLTQAMEAKEREEAKKAEPLNLGMVIAAHNTIANRQESKEATEIDAEALSGVEAPSIVKELQQRISQLSQLEGVDLKHETGMLKEMITANGDACRYLLPEDLGLMVRALRRMTDNKVAQDMGRARAPSAKTKAATTNLSASDVAGLLDSLDLEL